VADLPGVTSQGSEQDGVSGFVAFVQMASDGLHTPFESLWRASPCRVTHKASARTRSLYPLPPIIDAGGHTELELKYGNHCIKALSYLSAGMSVNRHARTTSCMPTVAQGMINAHAFQRCERMHKQVTNDRFDVNAMKNSFPGL
jgi:hypothetical protein